MNDVILITGGLGYLGARIAKLFSEQAEYSIRLGTRQTGNPMPHWLINGSFVPHDLSSENDLHTACRGVRCIIHLAALNEVDCASDPVEAFLINSLGTLRLLQAAEKAGVEQFIYFSTAHVYGAPLTGTITEDTLPRPVHPYAITHRAAEDYVLAANDLGKIRGLVLRLSNGFGSPAHHEVNRWMLLVNDLCRQAVTTRKLVLNSSGTQWRDFITLSNIGRAVLHMLDLKEWGNGLFNLGGECSLTVIVMAEKIADRCQEVLGFKPLISRQEPRSGEKVHFLNYSIEKLKATGFVLHDDFDAEIDATLRLCKRAFGEG